MNIDSIPRTVIYLLAISVLSYCLFIQYTAVSSYKESGKLYPISLVPIVWIPLMLVSAILTMPIFRKQKIGYLGLAIFLALLIRPLVRPKVPNETATAFFEKHKSELKKIVYHQSNSSDRKITNQEIRDLEFEELLIVDKVYFFMVWDENHPLPYGICCSREGYLPSKILNKPIKYTQLDKNWFEFNYRYE